MSASLFVFVHTNRFWTFDSYILWASTNFESALKYSFKQRVKREKRFCVKQIAHIYKAISMYFHRSILKIILQFWCERGPLHFRRISGNVQIRVWCVWPSANHYSESLFRYKRESPVHKRLSVRFCRLPQLATRRRTIIGIVTAGHNPSFVFPVVTDDDSTW